jgi:hypothetical protein
MAKSGGCQPGVPPPGHPWHSNPWAQQAWRPPAGQTAFTPPGMAPPMQPPFPPPGMAPPVQPPFAPTGMAPPPMQQPSTPMQPSFPPPGVWGDASPHGVCGFAGMPGADGGAAPPWRLQPTAMPPPPTGGMIQVAATRYQEGGSSSSGGGGAGVTDMVSQLRQEVRQVTSQLGHISAFLHASTLTDSESSEEEAPLPARTSTNFQMGP